MPVQQFFRRETDRGYEEGGLATEEKLLPWWIDGCRINSRKGWFIDKMTQKRTRSTLTRTCRHKKLISVELAVLAVMSAVSLSSCSGTGDKKVHASGPTVTVGVTKVVKKTLGRQITLSSELVPFQEIDVYAKESGYVKKLLVDYGTHVKAGQVMAILEIPELEAQLQEDQAEIKNAFNQVTRAQHELQRYQAQYKALHLQYTRLNGVFESQPGIVAQQEVDDAQGKDLAASSQVDAGQAALDAAQSQLVGRKGEAWSRSKSL